MNCGLRPVSTDCRTSCSFLFQSLGGGQQLATDLVVVGSAIQLGFGFQVLLVRLAKGFANLLGQFDAMLVVASEQGMTIAN